MLRLQREHSHCHPTGQIVVLLSQPVACSSSPYRLGIHTYTEDQTCHTCIVGSQQEFPAIKCPCSFPLILTKAVRIAASASSTAVKAAEAMNTMRTALELLNGRTLLMYGCVKSAKVRISLFFIFR